MSRMLATFVRDPANGLAELGTRAHGGVVRLKLGPFRPYLVTHPDHVQQVLRGNWANYRREGMFWNPLKRMLGDGILGDGPVWETSRAILQSLFTAPYVASLAGVIASTIDARVAELDGLARTGAPIDAAREMAAIVNQSVVRVLFGDRVSRRDSERLISAYHTADAAVTVRLLMPFMPYRLPLPGDRAFMNAVAAIDDVVFPVIRQAKAEGPGHGEVDVVSALCHGAGGPPRDERWIRDDLVSVYAAASETTATTLTWLWPLLDAHPEVAARLYAEIDEVVGEGPPLPSHVPELRYTKMVLQEVMRLYPAGWLFPRMATESEQIGGTRVKAGSMVLISPYATHRLEGFWDRPLVFDPERFAPDAPRRRHRYVYFPFGGGPHQCLGQHLFYMDAPLIVAALLSRFRPVSVGGGPFTPARTALLRPRGRVILRLRPARTTLRSPR
ncbi:cytochrome P450 [Sphaerisporangium melleum]|uniref:Cytochrome P450 n=1 Tax=Sphaerisporangium melleum TaxID=321316 RepID=A0A917R4P0_9ACTN|nr:cytochrome P450 [Sphaerisporangium melleum]GGK88839.1 cytochrome P450 [Sphaerisporangium melleum]GII67734.1 cytochrome P450 [Sphaerisporangium melleum]